MKTRKFGLIIVMFLTTFAFMSCDGGKENNAETTSDEPVEKKNENNFVEQSVAGLYKISLPDYFELQPGLNDEASLQMGNAEKEIYTIVIDEPTAEFYSVFDEYELGNLYSRDLTGFTDMVLETMEIDAGVFDIGEYREVKIDGWNGFQTEFYKYISDLKVYYHFTTIETDENFYQIMSWTFEDKLDVHKENMDKIAQSFKEI